MVAERAEIFVNFDWTEFEDSDQSLVVLGLQTEHGRSTPLVWKNVTRSELKDAVLNAVKDQRNDHEDELLVLFAALVPEGVRVTVVADRGFADSKLYEFLAEELGFDYIRFRAVVYMAAETCPERSVGAERFATAGSG